MKKLHIEDLVHFDFMDPPAPETLMRALELLNQLGALDDEGELTTEGAIIAEFPLDPMLAKTLLYASKMQVMQPVLSIVSILNSPPIFLRPKDKAKDADAVKMKFAHLDGDHLTYLTAYNTYLLQENTKEWCFENFVNPRAMKITDDVRGQLNDMMVKRDIGSHSLSPGDPNLNRNIKKSLLAGYFSQVAHLEKAGHY